MNFKRLGPPFPLPVCVIQCCYTFNVQFLLSFEKVWLGNNACFIHAGRWISHQAIEDKDFCCPLKKLNNKFNYFNILFKKFLESHERDRTHLEALRYCHQASSHKSLKIKGNNRNEKGLKFIFLWHNLDDWHYWNRAQFRMCPICWHERAVWIDEILESACLKRDFHQPFTLWGFLIVIYVAFNQRIWTFSFPYKIISKSLQLGLNFWSIQS